MCDCGVSGSYSLTYWCPKYFEMMKKNKNTEDHMVSTRLHLPDTKNMYNKHVISNNVVYLTSVYPGI